MFQIIRSMMWRQSHRFLLIVGVFLLVVVGVVPSSSARDDIDDVADALRRDVTVAVSTARIFTPDYPVVDLFIADPSIADVAASSPDTIYIYGKRPGRTTVVAYGQDGEIRSLINLRVTYDLEEIDNAINRMAPTANITLESTPSGILLHGVAKSSSDADTIIRTVTHFVGDASILNNVVVDMPSQVNVRVRIAEIFRSAGETLQFEWAGTHPVGDDAFGAFETGREFINKEKDATSLYLRGADPFSGSLLNSFAIGWAIPGVNITTMLDALEAENMATILAEPNLTALSGETANFLAGGEFPIPVAGALGQVNVTFKSYGVSLSFTPTVIDDSRISLRLVSEVSDLSASTTQVGGVSLPGLETRRAETVVELASGESFAIAGLIRNNVRSRLQQIPGLGDLPILGALFRSESFQKNQSELVIIVTPYVVQPIKKTPMVSTPMDGMMLTGRWERMLFGRLTQSTRGLEADESSQTEVSQEPFRRLGGFMIE